MVGHKVSLRRGNSGHAIYILDNDSVYFSAVERVLKALGHLVICAPFDPALVVTLPHRPPTDGHSLIMLGAWHCSTAVAAMLRAIARRPLAGIVLIVGDGALPIGSPSLRERIEHCLSPIVCTTAELDNYLQGIMAVERERLAMLPQSIERR